MVNFPPIEISLPRETRGWGKEELSRSMAIDQSRNYRSGEEIVIDRGDRSRSMGKINRDRWGNIDRDHDRW